MTISSHPRGTAAHDVHRLKGSMDWTADPDNLEDLPPLQQPSLVGLYPQDDNQGVANAGGLGFSNDQEWEPHTALQHGDDLFSEVSLNRRRRQKGSPNS